MSRPVHSEGPKGRGSWVPVQTPVQVPLKGKGKGKGRGDPRQVSQALVTNTPEVQDENPVGEF